jgi:ATP-dependent Clp protease ATP-binding subunit ClpA
VQLPLARLLLVGPAGIGKRAVAVAIARVLHVVPQPVCVDLAEFTDTPSAFEALFGGVTHEGILTSAACRNPARTIIFENGQSAPARLLDRLSVVLSAGQAVDGCSKAVVSFERCVFIFLHHCSPAWLDGDGSRSGGGSAALVAARLAEEGQIAGSLLTQLDGVHCFRPLDRMSQARVVAQLMRAECAKFNIELAYVAPEILAAALDWVSAETGFAPVPHRVARLLKDPLLRAVQNEQPRLVLEKRHLTELPVERNFAHA